MRVLLDTQALILAGQDRLPELAARAYCSRQNVVYFSLASLWEIGIKAALGKLEFNRRLTDEQKKKIRVEKALHKPDEWFTQEITAIGNHIVIKVNGQTTVDFVDESNKSMKGHFAIQFHDPTCKIQVRKVEVKELPKAK